MKTLALALSLVLVACGSPSSDAADSSEQAVSTEAPATPPPPPPPPVVEAPAPPETCASMRARAPGGAFSFDSADDSDGFVDVEADLSDLVKPDGAHEYVVALTFSTVKNLSLYATFGAFPMEARSFSFSGTVSSPTAVAEPWQGDFAGSGGGSFTQECKNGGFRGSGIDAGNSRSKISITKSSHDFIEGTFARLGENGEPFLTGTFKAPIRSNRVSTPSHAPGFAPKKALCCRLE